MANERFKHASRPIPDWPPFIPGYVVLLVVTCRGHETVHYCAREEAAEIVDLLAPHAGAVDRLLMSGESMENVVARFRRMAAAGS